MRLSITSLNKQNLYFRSSFSLIPGERATTDEPQGNQDDAFIVTPPETMIYDQLYKISFPSREEDILPRILWSIATRILGSENNTTESILVPLPVLSKRSIDFLPTVNLTLNIEPRQFNMESFLQCLASDMKIDREEMVVTEAREGSVIMGFKLSRHIANNRKQLRNIEQILLSRELPSTRRFLATHIHSDPMPSTESNSAAEDRINVTLENFNNRTIDAIRLCPEVIDASLRMSAIKDILDRNEWKFLCEKTQQIAECLMHASKHCPFDYTLENALLICNKTLVNQYRRKYGRRSDHEKLLFHGTDARNFEGIFKTISNCLNEDKQMQDGMDVVFISPILREKLSTIPEDGPRTRSSISLAVWLTSENRDASVISLIEGKK